MNYRRGHSREISTEGTEDTEDTEDVGAVLVQPNHVSGEVVDAAMKVHSVLGPGLLESAYAACLAFELRRRGLRVDQQLPLPVIYEGVRVDAGDRLDMLVDGTVIVELKAVANLLPVHHAQAMSYLKLSGCRVGLLINFHVAHLKNGIRRFING